MEYGFADSTGDDVSQLKNNWEGLAEAVVKSLAEYIGVPYTPVSTENTYIVKNGDTLWSIARNNGLTVDELKRMNNLTSNTLSIGQVLKVSGSTTPSESEEYYVVKSGDSLYKIANQFGTTVDELKRMNNLTSNLLSIGQRLRIPNMESYQTYTVKSGDTLYSIARNFNTTVTAIQNLNNLATSALSIGQKLLIP